VKKEQYHVDMSVDANSLEKHWHLLTSLHDAETQKKIILTAMKSSYLSTATVYRLTENHKQMDLNVIWTCTQNEDSLPKIVMEIKKTKG
jgi:hypothetical protein